MLSRVISTEEGVVNLELVGQHEQAYQKSDWKEKRSINGYLFFALQEWLCLLAIQMRLWNRKNH